MTAPTLPLHLGALHPVEQVLTLLLAFGPFLLLGAVVWWRRRTERQADDEGSTTVPGGPGAAPRQRER